MESFGFDSGYAYESDFSVSNMAVRLSFGSRSAYEFDLSSSTVQCSCFDPGSYGSDIPFLGEIAVDAESARGIGPPASTKIPLDTKTTHGRGIPRSTYIVCLSWDARFAPVSDLLVSNEIPFERKTASGSENPSSTDTMCQSSEPKTTYEPDVLDSTDTACLPSEPWSAHASAVTFLTKTRCLPFDRNAAHESTFPFSTETPFGFGFAYEPDILDSDSVCFPSELGSAYASDDAYSTKIPCEPEATYCSENPSSSDTICLSSEPETYASDILDSTETACLPCEPGSAYVFDVSHATDIQVETASAFGSGFRFSEIWFDTRFAKGADIPYSTTISFGTCFAYEYDLASAYGFDLSFTNVTQNVFDHGSAYGSAIHFSNKTVSLMITCSQCIASINGSLGNPFQSHGDYVETILKQTHLSNVGIHTVSESIPFDAPSRPSNPFSMQHHDWPRLMAETKGSVHITNQPTCSQVAASMDGNRFESYVNDGKAGLNQVHVNNVDADTSKNDSPRMAEHNRSKSALRYNQIKEQSTFNPFLALISGHPNDVGLKQSYNREAAVRSVHNDSIPVCEHEFTQDTLCKPICSDSAPLFALTMAHYSARAMRETNSSQSVCYCSQIIEKHISDKSASDSVCETIPCGVESAPSFSSIVKHETLGVIQVDYYSESSSCRSHARDELMCNQFTASIHGSLVDPSQSHGDDAVHWVNNDLVSVCDCECASCRVCEAGRCGDETESPFSLTLGQDSIGLLKESCNSESSLDCSQVRDQLTCSRFAASINGSQTHNRTHQDVSDVGGVPETSERHIDAGEDEAVDASNSKSEQEENILVFDTGGEAPCVGQWIIIACILLRWHCRPTSLENRPRYLRTRSEVEALDTNPQDHLVSKRLRRCVALAKIRKRFRAWRIDTKSEKYDRIGHVVGVAFLLIVMFQPVAEGTVVASVISSSMNMSHHHNETALVNASNVHTDMNQLSALNVDPELKEFIGSLVMGFQSELRELKVENMAMKGEIAAMQKENVRITIENLEIRKENAEIQIENTDLKKRTLALEIANVKIREENSEMMSVVSAVEGEITEMKVENADSQTEHVQMRKQIADLKMQAAETESGVLTTVTEMSSRLDRCEAEISPFLSAMERRRMQDEETHCRGSGMLAMFASCCPSSSDRGGHRRSAQSAEGCDSLPPTCSASCAPLFIDYVDGCQSIVDTLVSDQRQVFMDFYSDCQDVEQSTAEFGTLEPVNVQMFRIMISSDATQAQAEIFGNGDGNVPPTIGPLPELPPPSPPSELVPPSEQVQEYHALCTTQNILTCVPTCNASHHGFELLAMIDGTDTKFSCNFANQRYSWVGAAALGGSIGSDPQAFLSAVLSGASGTYLLHTEGTSLGIDTDITIRPDQHVRIIGNGTQWGRGAITIQDQASLELFGIELIVSFTVEPGTCALSMTDCEVILPAPLVVPTGANVTMRVDRTRIGVVRTVETFSSFQLGIAVDGALTMHALDLFWGSNVYVGIWVAEAGRLSCAQCSMDMTPLGMYSLYQDGAPRFALPQSSPWQDLTTELRTLEGHSDSVSSVAFDASGGTLASGSWDQTVKLWDVASGECLRTLEGHSSYVNSVAFDASGGTLASGSNDRTVKLWDVASTECLRTLEGHSDDVLSVAFDASGGKLASGSWDQTVKLWDVASGECLRTLEGHSSEVYSVAFDASGGTLASGSGDRTVKLWDVASTECLRTLEGHTSYVNSVAFDASGGTLASGSWDLTVKLWDVASGECLRTLEGHSSYVNSVAFDAGGGTLASGSWDLTVKLWDVASGECLRTLEGHSSEVYSVAFDASGGTLASGSRDQTMKLWDIGAAVFASQQNRMVVCLESSVHASHVHAPNVTTTFEGQSDVVSSVAFDESGGTLASGSWDQTVKLWDVASGECLRTLEGHSDVVLSVAFDASGGTLASGSGDQTVKLWDVASGECLRTLEGHSSYVLSVAFDASGGTLASGSGDHTVKLWDAASGECLRTLEGHSDDVYSVAFDASGGTLASGSWDLTVKLWDVASIECLRTLEGHTSYVNSVAFDAGGGTLASGSGDLTVKLWDVASGECLRTLEGHSDDVYSVAFDASGGTLASGSWDLTVKLWDVASGECLRTLEGHSSYVNSVAFDASGSTLASGSWDLTVKLWVV
eukprot:SAG11_NODE_39_length_21630_cov_11.188658_18_plen_2153_part_00